MNIVVGVTGGIAAYKAVHLVRLLAKAGHDVTVVPTEDALRFVGTPTWEAISRHPVTTSVHDDVARVRHVALGQGADLVVVAPATANTIAKMTAGIADDLLGTTLLATLAPVLIAPAMHAEMWRHPATQANIATLRARGVHLVGPADGELAGGDSGPGRMAEPEEIAEAAQALLGPGDLAGLRVAISAGGTAAELSAAMKEEAASADVVIMAAAVADYRPAQAATQKLTKEDGGLERLDLVENEDVVAALAAARTAGRAPEGQTIVAVAAETLPDAEQRRERARRKRERKGVDLLAVNLADAENGFERAENAVEVIGAGGDVVEAAAGSKREVAAAIWDAVIAAR